MTTPSTHDPGAEVSFETAFAFATSIAGWLSEQQARRLFERARDLSAGGRIIEIGSHQGRSTVILALAAKPGVEVVAIDPYSGGQRVTAPGQTDDEAGEIHLDAFWRNVSSAGIQHKVRLVRASSQDAHPNVTGDVSLLYIDGAHEFRPAFLDVRFWGARVEDSGTMLIHDAFCSVGVTTAQMRLLFLTPRFRYMGRNGSLAEYRREPLHGLAILVNATRQAASLPWFIRNVLVKVGIRARATWLVRALGHEGADFPY